MLVLSRQLDESIVIRTPEGQTIRVMVVAIDARRGQIKLGVEADRSVVIHRDEIDRIPNEEKRHHGAS